MFPETDGDPPVAFVAQDILSRITTCLQNADPKVFHDFVTLIEGADRVFVAGAGRSGLVGRMFAVRLMHLAKTVFVVGETTTPRLGGAGDLLLAVSGSGNTESVLNTVRTARLCGARVAGITLKTDDPRNELSEIADQVVRLERRRIPRGPESQSIREAEATRVNRTPLGTTFELCALLYLEAVIAEIISRNQVPESDLMSRHTNLK